MSFVLQQGNNAARFVNFIGTTLGFDSSYSFEIDLNARIFRDKFACQNAFLVSFLTCRFEWRCGNGSFPMG